MKLKRPKLSMDVKPHLRLEIMYPDELAETVLSTLESMAQAGLRGDGKMYVLQLEQAIRISSGERGDEAV
jgi:nitrogen regulatory protein PII